MSHQAERIVSWDHSVHLSDCTKLTQKQWNALCADGVLDLGDRILATAKVGLSTVVYSSLKERSNDATPKP